jgi:hypothetical protein
MGKFVYAYTGGRAADSEEEQQKAMEAWGAWFGSLGDAVVDMGNPFGASQNVGGNGGAALTGYSIVSAGSLDDAVAKAQTCPVIENGGGVSVYEALEM